MWSSGNDAGSVLGETVVALALIGLLTMLVLQLTVTSRGSRLERAQLEQMMGMAHAYLAEAHLGDCAAWRLTTADPIDPTHSSHPCYAPLDPLSDTNIGALPGACAASSGGGVKFTHRTYEVQVSDCEGQAFGRNWPIRTVAIADVTGRLDLERSAVGRPL